MPAPARNGLGPAPPRSYAAAGRGFATGSGPRALAQFGLYGLGIGLVIWLAIALSHPWPQYLITTGWLAAHGRVPWPLASFLAEAHDLQILSQRGGAYQFRHARLQDRLASRDHASGATQVLLWNKETSRATGRKAGG